jgi:hypothetical protein
MLSPVGAEGMAKGVRVRLAGNAAPNVRATDMTRLLMLTIDAPEHRFSDYIGNEERDVA